MVLCENMSYMIINKKTKKNDFRNKYELKNNNAVYEDEEEDKQEQEGEYQDDESDEDENYEDDNDDEYEDNEDDENDEYIIKENYDNNENEQYICSSDDYKNEIKMKYENRFLSKIINELNDVYIYNMFSNCSKEEKIIKDINNLPKTKLDKKYIEVGCLGFWKLSSSINKLGIKHLKDNNANTYWQSTSSAPHTITIQFIKLMKISKIYLLFNYMLDESYTPYEISIKIGNDENHLEFLCNTFCDINSYSLNDPFWFIIDVKYISPLSYLYNYNIKFSKHRNFIYCHCLQIVILSSQHNGKDTRIRQIKVFGPNYFLYKYDKMLI